MVEQELDPGGVTSEAAGHSTVAFCVVPGPWGPLSIHIHSVIGVGRAAGSPGWTQGLAVLPGSWTRRPQGTEGDGQGPDGVQGLGKVSSVPELIRGPESQRPALLSGRNFVQHPTLVELRSVGAGSLARSRGLAHRYPRWQDPSCGRRFSSLRASEQEQPQSDL